MNPHFSASPISISEEAQKLYVRLFGRQFKWILKTKIKYPKIAEDLTGVFTELVKCDLLLDGNYTYMPNSHYI